MRTAKKNVGESKRGRPATGSGVPIHVRLQEPVLSALDDWIMQCPDPKPSRPDVIRRALNAWLTGMELQTPPRTVAGKVS